MFGKLEDLRDYMKIMQETAISERCLSIKETLLLEEMMEVVQF